MYDALQLIGGLLLSLAYLPQITKILRTRSTRDMHLGTYALIALSIALMEVNAWHLYLQGSWAYLVTNSIALIMASVMAGLVWWYGKHGVRQRTVAGVIADYEAKNTPTGEERSWFEIDVANPLPLLSPQELEGLWRIYSAQQGEPGHTYTTSTPSTS